MIAGRTGNRLAGWRWVTVSAAIWIFPPPATKKTPWPSQSVTGFASRRAARLSLPSMRRVWIMSSVSARRRRTVSSVCPQRGQACHAGPEFTRLSRLTEFGPVSPDSGPIRRFV